MDFIRPEGMGLDSSVAVARDVTLLAVNREPPVGPWDEETRGGCHFVLDDSSRALSELASPWRGDEVHKSRTYIP